MNKKAFWIRKILIPFAVGLFFSLLVCIIDYNFPEYRGPHLLKNIIIGFFVIGFLSEFIFPQTVFFLVVGVYTGQVLYFTGGYLKDPLSGLLLLLGLVFGFSVFMGALVAFFIRKLILYIKNENKQRTHK